MSYSAGEALLLTQIRAVSGLSSDNAYQATAVGWKPLNRGKARNYVFLAPGSFERARVSVGGLGGSQGTHETRYITYCEVWARSGTDYPGAIAQVLSDVDAIITRLDQYRKAGDTGGTIHDVFVRSAGEPEDINDGKWVRQILQIEWIEHETVTYQE